MNIQSHIKRVFQLHEQYYPNSCAASGMELVLKIHSLVPMDFRGFQDLCKDTNIGFEKLLEMNRFGISARDYEEPVDYARAIIRAELAEGRYPIVSLPNQQGCWHIWIAFPNGDNISFLSRAFDSPMPLSLDDSTSVTQNLDALRQGKLHFVTYSLTEAEQFATGQPARRPAVS